MTKILLQSSFKVFNFVWSTVWMLHAVVATYDMLAIPGMCMCRAKSIKSRLNCIYHLLAMAQDSSPVVATELLTCSLLECQLIII